MALYPRRIVLAVGLCLSKSDSFFIPGLASQHVMGGCTTSPVDLQLLKRALPAVLVGAASSSVSERLAEHVGVLHAVLLVNLYYRCESIIVSLDAPATAAGPGRTYR